VPECLTAGGKLAAMCFKKGNSKSQHYARDLHYLSIVIIVIIVSILYCEIVKGLVCLLAS